MSKYRKPFENCLRLCLVLHELWRVAGQEAVGSYTQETEEEELREWDRERDLKITLEAFREQDPRDFYGQRIEWQPNVVDRLTVERAIAVGRILPGTYRAGAIPHGRGGG